MCACTLYVFLYFVYDLVINIYIIEIVLIRARISDNDVDNDDDIL